MTRTARNRYRTIRNLISSKRRPHDWKKRERDEVGHSTQNDDDTASSGETSPSERVLQPLHGTLERPD